MQRNFYVKRFKKGIIIAPAKSHIKKLTDALYFFSERDPEMFRKFRSMKAVLVYSGRGGESEYGYYCEDRIWVCPSNLIAKATVPYLASTLVHETWHLIQCDRGSKSYGARVERGAYKKQREFLMKLGMKETAEWLDGEFKKQWWISRDKDGSGIKVPPSKPLRKFITDYRRGKLKLKEI